MAKPKRKHHLDPTSSITIPKSQILVKPKPIKTLYSLKTPKFQSDLIFQTPQATSTSPSSSNAQWRWRRHCRCRRQESTDGAIRRSRWIYLRAHLADRLRSRFSGGERDLEKRKGRITQGERKEIWEE